MTKRTARFSMYSLLAAGISMIALAFRRKPRRLSDSEIAENLRQSEGDQDVPGAPL